MDKLERRLLASDLVRVHKVEGVDHVELAEALEHVQLQTLPTRTVVYAEGARSDELKVLIKGSVRVQVGPQERVVATLRAPAILGHLGVLTGLARSATVLTESEAVVGTLSARDLWEMIEGRLSGGPAMRRLLLGSMAQLLASTNQRVADQVADVGTPAKASTPPKAAPASKPDRPEPARRTARRSQLAAAGENDSWGFDRELLDAAESIQIVHSEADERHKYSKK